MQQMWPGINFLWEAKFRRQKIGQKKTKFGQLSTEEITDNVIPVTTRKP